jgi:hypothetical protein
MKYDDLVAEANVRVIHAETRAHSTMGDTDLIQRLAAAIRDLQQHVPPEGWRVTEWKRGGDFAFSPQHGHTAGLWFSMGKSGKQYGPFPTAAAAMAAIEETK